MEENNKNTDGKKQISVEDIKRWGAFVLENTDISITPKSYNIIVIPPNTEIINKNNRVIATSTKEKTIAFYDITSHASNIGNPQDFRIDTKDIPTLSDVNSWNKREKNLSAEQKAMLDAYIDREVSYESGSNDLQTTRKRNLYNGLIKDKEWFDSALQAEKEYQSKDSIARHLYDLNRQHQARQREKDFKRQREENFKRQHTKRTKTPFEM